MIKPSKYNQFPAEYDDGYAAEEEHIRRQEEQARRCAEILARPEPAYVCHADALGMILAVTCPFCGQEHRHEVNREVWGPEWPMAAVCGGGEYHLAVAPFFRLAHPRS